MYSNVEELLKIIKIKVMFITSFHFLKIFETNGNVLELIYTFPIFKNNYI